MRRRAQGVGLFGAIVFYPVLHNAFGYVATALLSPPSTQGKLREFNSLIQYKLRNSLPRRKHNGRLTSSNLLLALFLLNSNRRLRPISKERTTFIIVSMLLQHQRHYNQDHHLQHQRIHHHNSLEIIHIYHYYNLSLSPSSIIKLSVVKNV